jgi:hypothetical protein
MTDRYTPTLTDLTLLARYKSEAIDWVNRNPGMLFKVGGKHKSTNRHHDATHYNRKYFDTDSAFSFLLAPSSTADKQHGSSSC